MWFRKRPGKLRKGNSYQPLEFKDAKRNDIRKCCNQFCFPTATFPNDQNKQLETWWNRGDTLYNILYIYISYICLWVGYLFLVGCRVVVWRGSSQPLSSWHQKIWRFWGPRSCIDTFLWEASRAVAPKKKPWWTMVNHVDVSENSGENSPQSHPLKNRVFHYFHHPFWGTSIFGNTFVGKAKSIRNNLYLSDFLF